MSTWDLVHPYAPWSRSNEPARCTATPRPGSPSRPHLEALPSWASKKREITTQITQPLLACMASAWQFMIKDLCPARSYFLRSRVQNYQGYSKVDECRLIWEPRNITHNLSLLVWPKGSRWCWSPRICWHHPWPAMIGTTSTANVRVQHIFQLPGLSLGVDEWYDCMNGKHPKRSKCIINRLWFIVQYIYIYLI